MSENYKVTENETNILLNRVEKQKDFIRDFFTAVMSRKPGTFQQESVLEKFRVYLNKAKTVYLQPVWFYGGENFNEPYCFTSEVIGTTKVGVTRFFKGGMGRDIKVRHFNY